MQSTTFMPLIGTASINAPEAMPGNLERFLQVSTPVIITRRRGSHTTAARVPKIAQLFEGITKVSAKGLRIEFYEATQAPVQQLISTEDDSELLVYTPVLSLFKLRFKKNLNLPKIQFETSSDSLFN